MSEEIEGYENNLELELFKEYRDVIGLFKFVVETERRFLSVQPRGRAGAPGGR